MVESLARNFRQVPLRPSGTSPCGGGYLNELVGVVRCEPALVEVETGL